jgi:hypothetical protein
MLRANFFFFFATILPTYMGRGDPIQIKLGHGFRLKSTSVTIHGAVWHNRQVLFGKPNDECD